MADDMLPILREAAQTPGLLKMIYGDLARPGVAQVGKALSTIIGLGNTLLWPVALVNEKAKIALQRNLEKYRAQLDGVPEEKIVQVPPEVGVPIAEKLAYVTNDELSTLYVNLLAKASTRETASCGHPSFANIIQNLSPDEAILLKELRDPTPFLTAKFVKKVARDWWTAGDLLTGLETSVCLTFPNNLVAYFSNFDGLGLIGIRRDLCMAAPPLYEKLEEHYRPVIEAFPYDRENHDLEFARGKIEVTPFGRLFIDACLKGLRET